MPGPRDDDPPHRSTGRLLPRRRVATSGGALALLPVLTLSGCWIDPPKDSTASTDDETPVPTGASDLDVVRRVVEQIDEVLDQIAAMGTPVATPVATLATMHTAHREVLAAALGSAATSTPAPGADPRANTEENPRTGATAPTALGRLRRAEARLQSNLAAAATEVSSGQLARVLGSATAGVAQGSALLAQAGAQ